VTWMWETRNTFRCLVRKPLEKWSFRSPIRRWEDISKTKLWKVCRYRRVRYFIISSSSSSSSFLGSTAQLRPWPPPQNPAEFLGGFSTIFFFTG
jgi:hypothetical protein